MKVQLFWHVALMGTWRRVTREQSHLFASVGLKPKIGVLGWGVGVDVMGEVVYRSKNVREFETPTLHKLWEWCHEHPHDAVIYCHTKGVSKPGPMRRAWRKLMEYHVIDRWRENLPLLENHDAVGVNWRTSCSYCSTGHFTGTFWMARADWINTLLSPYEHRAAGHPDKDPSHPLARWRLVSWPRMHAEAWIGSRPGARVVSLACQDEPRIAALPVLQRLLRQCKHPEYT